MNIVVLQDLKSNTSGAGYNNCIKIGYLFAKNLISAGVDDQYIFYSDIFSNFSINQKIDGLMGYNETQNRDNFGLIEVKKHIKWYNNKKGKSSRDIIDFKLLMKKVEATCESYMDIIENTLISTYGVDEISKLIDDDFFFLLPPRWTLPDNTNLGHTSAEDLYSLQFKVDGIKNFMFFLNLEAHPGFNFNIPFEDINSKNAKNNDLSYGEVAFKIPLLNLANATDIKAAKNQLLEKISYFNDKMTEWATICFQNPTTDAGLNFLKKSLKPLFKDIEKELYENPTIKNIPKNSKVAQAYELIIAQMPVEKIWDWMKFSNNMTEDEYKEVLDFKSNFPGNFEGRWPILFLKPIPVDNFEEKYESEKAIEQESAIIQSVRKTIALD